MGYILSVNKKTSVLLRDLKNQQALLFKSGELCQERGIVQLASIVQLSACLNDAAERLPMLTGPVARVFSQDTASITQTPSQAIVNERKKFFTGTRQSGWQDNMVNDRL
jgi:hypothetical protein